MPAVETERHSGPKGKVAWPQDVTTAQPIKLLGEIVEPSSSLLLNQKAFVREKCRTMHVLKGQGQTVQSGAS